MQCLKCGNDFDHFYECPLCAEVWRKSSRFNRIVTRLEDGLIALFLAMMVLMVLAQIVLRNLFQSGIPGGEDFIRHLVLWIAFVGAGVATRSNAHVRIDALTHLVGKAGVGRYVDVAVGLFSGAVCLILLFASCHFVWIEFQNQDHSAFFHLPIWVMQTIIPLGYAIIALRFFHNSIGSMQDIRRRKQP